MRVNKTEKNLKLVVKQLDNASGELYNALDALARMKGLSPEVDRLVQGFDVTPVDALKQLVEQLVEEKQEEKEELVRKVENEKAERKVNEKPIPPKIKVVHEGFTLKTSEE